MNCNIHPNKLASGTCSVCHQPFCEECLVNVDGNYYCKEHVAELLENKGKYTGEAGYNNHQNGYNPNAHANTSGSYHYQDQQGPGYGPHNTINNNFYGAPNFYPYKNKVIALLLAIFLGFGGIHRFYVGKIGTGLLWLFTGGFFGIGWFIDIVLIALGAFRDKYGYPLI